MMPIVFCSAISLCVLSYLCYVLLFGHSLSLNMRKSKASQHDVSEIPYCIALRCLLPVALALEA